MIPWAENMYLTNDLDGYNRCLIAWNVTEPKFTSTIFIDFYFHQSIQEMHDVVYRYLGSIQVRNI